jgi:hypothetical protein
VEVALAEVERIAAGEDAQAIGSAVAGLEQTCGFYVERRMNQRSTTPWPAGAWMSSSERRLGGGVCAARG